MKRTRAKSYGSSRRHDDAAVSFNKTSSKTPEKSWDDYVGGKSDDAFAPYSLKARYELGALVVHDKFGKGAIVHVEDQRVDVLFADAKRKLAHNLP